MYFIGIDISKFKHDCAIVDELGDVVTSTKQAKAKTLRNKSFSEGFGTPDWIRTSGLQSRSLTRYPTAPRARINFLLFNYTTGFCKLVVK